MEQPQVETTFCKICKVCNVLKNRFEFIRCPSSTDGFQNKCKDCVKEERAIWNKLKVSCEFCQQTESVVTCMTLAKLRKHVKDKHWEQLKNKRNRVILN